MFVSCECLKSLCGICRLCSDVVVGSGSRLVGERPPVRPSSPPASAFPSVSSGRWFVPRRVEGELPLASVAVRPSAAPNTSNYVTSALMHFNSEYIRSLERTDTSRLKHLQITERFKAQLSIVVIFFILHNGVGGRTL